MPVGEMLSRISSRELAEWLAYSGLAPFGDERADLRAGIIAATTANAFRKSDTPPYKPQDFVPRFEPPKEDWRLVLEKVKGLNAALGGTYGNNR